MKKITDMGRSLAFNLFFFAGSLACSVVLLPALLLPERKCAQVVSDFYGGYVAFIEKHIMGLRLDLKGLENVPASGAYIIAAKHQSAFETLKLPYMRILGYPAIILKKELTRIPLWGWYPARMGQIAIDRGSAKEALDSIVSGCEKKLAEGRPVIIFPQGTRTAVGAKQPYKAGIAKVYRDVAVPVVPVALNSGVFWGKNAFFKKSGTVTFEFLPPIPSGLPPLQMMERLEKAIEEASDRLVSA
ncbi:MAG: 1-acyl-sn-glycerol-3-phosphate acyltransferase, partial [Alphaproteobacteria bacterium]|nr:1-acyl-sn-glycerol-3-phosphate acyltransferase [Alphaproteobacteria bacterium]